ncbi:MAG TPA: hypothetical protein EYQ47_04450 [Cycloclasticus sp.]|jgi:hypothetical protein|nr:hypothetical protein [Cycloclasticus sp.]
MTKVGIGLVGYYQFVRGYPIGPTLKENIDAATWLDVDLVTKEMNWGPIAIVQEFQAEKIEYDRFILVTAVDRGLPQGTVTCRRWLGGELDVLSVQDRVFEAVTGVISMDNLLVIGEHFGIWPKEVITVEAQLSDTAFGDLVMSEMEINRQRGEMNIIGDNPLSEDMEVLVQQLFESVQQAVQHGSKAMTLESLTIDNLNELSNVCHNQFMSDSKRSSETH